MPYALPLQSAKSSFINPKMDPTAEKSEDYIERSTSPTCFPPETNFEPTFWSTPNPEQQRHKTAWQKPHAGDTKL